MRASARLCRSAENPASKFDARTGEATPGALSLRSAKRLGVLGGGSRMPCLNRRRWRRLAAALAPHAHPSGGFYSQAATLTCSSPRGGWRTLSGRESPRGALPRLLWLPGILPAPAETHSQAVPPSWGLLGLSASRMPGCHLGPVPVLRAASALHSPTPPPRVASTKVQVAAAHGQDFLNLSWPGAMVFV